MLARPLPAGAGLVIVPCSSIHTQFMRFPIDVLYVNKEDVIAGIDRNLRPWRVGRFYKKVHYVVELPAGGAEGCQVGDGIFLIALLNVISTGATAPGDLAIARDSYRECSPEYSALFRCK